MIKKLLIISCLLLIISGCATEKKTINNRTIKPIEDKFEYESAKCLCNYVAVEYSLFNRGDEIEIVNQDDDYYYINKDNLTLAIDKGLVRTQNEKAFEEYNGYSKSGSGLYSDYELNNKIKELSVNDNVHVIDSFLDVLYVTVDGTKGYMKNSQVSETKISTYVAPKIDPVAPPVDDGGSHHSHSSSDDKPSSKGDGEDIHLGFASNEYETILLESTSALKGTILADDTVAYLTVLKRYDDVMVIDKDEDKYTLVIQGRKTTVDKCFVRLDTEEMYEAWDAYTYGDVNVYLEYQQKHLLKTLPLNTYVRVIDKINDIYVIEYDNGMIGYVNLDDVSETSIEEYNYEEVTSEVAPVETESRSSGSHSSTPKQDKEWTAPAL